MSEYAPYPVDERQEWVPCLCPSCGWDGDLHVDDDAICGQCGFEVTVLEGPPLAWYREQDDRLSQERGD